MRLVLLIPIVAACSTDDYARQRYSCPFTEVGPVDRDDPGTLGFTATDVVSAASVSITGQSEITADLPDPLAVALSLGFTIAGDPSVVDFGQPSDATCPVGAALRVPVVYDLAGTIGTWAVSDTAENITLFATAAALDAISSEASGDSADAWQASADPALEAAARSTIPASIQANCAMTFSIGPRPFDLTAGAWSEEITSRDYLDFDCANYSASFVRWSADTVAPLGG